MLSRVKHKLVAPITWRCFTALNLVLLSLLGARVGLADTQRDPTRPLDYVATQNSAAPVLKLESVLIAAQRSLATINGQTVSLNGVVAGAKVIKIVPGSVTVVAQGRRQQLFVSAPVKKMKKVSRK